MKVLLTGATGFVGRQVLQQLHQAGHQARLLTRSTKAAAERLPPSQGLTEFHRGDVTEPRSLSGAARGCDAVIHLVGIIREFGAVTFERLHVDATRNVIAMAQADGVGRFLHMSALGTRAGAVARYHQTKWRAEILVRNSGLDSTIFRPSLIHGPEDQFVNQFERLSRWMPFLPILGSGTARLQPVSVHLVARSFVRALTTPDSIGQTYDLCGPDRLTLGEILDAILSATGRKRFKVRIPLPLARAQAALLDILLGRLLHIPPPLSRDQVQMLQEDNVGNPEPARELFGLEPVSFNVGIRTYLTGAR